MKHITFAVVCLGLLAAPAWAQWSDNFQSYTVGNPIIGSGGWAGWDGNAFPTAIVVDDPGTPGVGDNALKVVTSNNLVRELTGFTSGTWQFTAQVYIPTSAHVNSSTSNVAYLRLLNNYVSGGAKGYGASLNFNLGSAATTSDTVSDGQAGGSRAVVFDTWVEVKVLINLDANFRQTYYNGALIGVGPWYSPADPNQAQSIAAVNLEAGSNAAVVVNCDEMALVTGTSTACPGEGSEDFQTYALGSILTGQCSWTGWGGGTFNGEIAADPDPNATPGNQVLMEHANNDIVQQYWSYTSGAWVYSIRQYIPSAAKATNGVTTFILMNRYTTTGNPRGWGLSLNCDLVNDVVKDAEANENAVPIVYDQWVPIRVEIDLDANIRSSYYNNTLVGTTYWYREYDTNHGKAIAAVDLWADVGGDPVYYDDIAITPGTPVAPPPGTDLTTTPKGSTASRYLVDLGQNNGSTVRPYLYVAQGLYEITNSGGNRSDQSSNWNYWWKINDGTFGIYSDLVTYGVPGPDYVGYKFKLPATVSSIVFWNDTRYGDGGPFAATPEIQYLDTMNGSNWQTIPAENITWDKPYLTTFSGGIRRYVITLNNPPTAIWGIRLYGQGAGTGDGDGFIGVTELTLYGQLELGSLDVNTNLARAPKDGATATAIAFPSNGTGVANLIDGSLTSAFNTFKAVNWDANSIPPRTNYYGTFEDYLGVTWSAPQTNVAALGIVFTGYRDGGYFGRFGGGSCSPGDEPFRIEYTTDPNVTTNAPSVTWTPVTNLNYGRYPQDLRTIRLIAPWTWVCSTGFLFQFDAIPSGITGLRIIGTVGKVSADGDGFVGAYELEVFGNQ